MFGNYDEARMAFDEDFQLREDAGIVPLPETQSYFPDSWRKNYDMAMDAQPSLSTTANSGVPWFLLNYTDPKIYRVLFAPVKAAKITGEERKGDWKSQTATFPIVEHDGETSAYGDYNNNAMSGANSNFPQRQNFRYQTIIRYGELELEQAGAARINWASELEASVANNMMRFENFSYFFGIQNLQNYGLLNDPNLGAALTPAVKGYGGSTWFVGTVLKALPTEVYNDILSIYYQLVVQTGGIVSAETKLVLGLSPASEVALKAINSYGMNTYEALEENLPSLRIESAVQYGALTAANSQGVAGGNFMQMIAEDLDGYRPLTSAYSEKLRSHPLIRDLSAFRQKKSAGTYGCVIRQAMGVASMIGI